MPSEPKKQELKDELLKKVKNLPKRCYNCDGTDKRYYGECQCAYDYKYLVDMKEVEEIINKL